MSNQYFYNLSPHQLHPHHHDHGDINVYSGKSAYQSAVSNGFEGDEATWLTTLVGAASTVPGPQGIPGESITGPQGPQGVSITGPQGPPGESITGPQGPPGEDGADSTVVGPQGPPGNNGLDSTVPGPQGPIGLTGADSTVPGPQGPQGIQGEIGPQGPADGDSAYTVAVQNGFVGTETEWLASLIGADGILGGDGADGAQGPIGLTGPQGIEGPQGPSNGIVGPQGPEGTVANYANLVARLTTLETYSPLAVTGNGSVTSLTFTNKEEIVFDNQLTNSTLQGEGTTALWQPSDIGGLLAHLSTKELTSTPTSWLDLTGNGHNLDFQGSVPPVLDTTTYAYPTMRYSNLYSDRQRSYGRYPSAFRGKTFCFIHAMDLGSGETQFHRRSVMEGDIQASTSTYIAYTNGHFNAASSAKYHINGLDSMPNNPWNNSHTTTLSVVSYQTNGSSGIGANVIGHGRGGGANRYGMDGVIGEILIFDTYLSADDIRRVEGWMAHKWGITTALQGDANNVPHPYRLSAPVNNDAFMVDSWSLESGIWDTAELLNNSLLISSNDSPITVRQMVNLTFGEVYEVVMGRGDVETALIVKLKTDVNVKWISHQDDETDTVDIPHGEGAVFEVIGTVPTYIEIDTVMGDLSITNVTLFRKRLASGTITEITNNTIYKSTGIDGWNAGTSSVEHFDGQAEAYVQFQMAQTGKSIKIGLTHNDIDYINTAPYQMLFNGTYVFIEDFQYPYVTGDWFRIRHDSVNNQILYQKRGTDLLYSTIYTNSGTTDGRDFYLDTSFYHVDGRINDISMVSGAGEGVNQGPIYPWGVGPVGPAGADGADGTPGGPVGPAGADGVGSGTYFIPKTDGLIIAHRGLSELHPENTILAFNKAWEEKADGIEADFRLTSDGIVVCIHDSTTNRTEITGLNRTVSSSTYAQLNAGNYGDGVGIPTLEDVLDTIPRGKLLQLELKTYSKEMIDAVKVVIDAHDIESNQIAIICFTAGTSTTGLKYCKTIMPNINTLLLKDFGSDTSASVIDTSLAVIKDIKADGYVVNKTLFLTHDNTTYINKIKDAGLFLGVYTNNIYWDSIILQDRGVDSITTDTAHLHHDFRIKKMKSYAPDKLNNYHIDGDTTIVTGLNTNNINTTNTKHLYFYDNSWWSSFDGSLVQTWNVAAVNDTVVLTFKTGQANNQTISSTYGSAITTTTDAHIITGSGCPDINIDWNTAGGNGLAYVWEIHGASSFATAFGSTNLPILQMDLNAFTSGQGGGTPTNPTIKFTTTTASAQVKIVGFRIGDATDRTAAASAWILNIYENDTTGNKVYTQTTNAMGAGDFQDIVINYMGAEGVNYMLEFDDQGTNGYTTAINNLTFEQHTGETPTGDLVP